MDEHEFLAQQFEEYRTRLRAVAYRMLGTLSDGRGRRAGDVAALRPEDDTGLENVRAWLTTVVARVCLDSWHGHRAARKLLGPWHAEPSSTRADGPTRRQGLIGRSVGMAMLVVLETLKPAERPRTMLHAVMGVPFPT